MNHFNSGHLVHLSVGQLVRLSSCTFLVFAACFYSSPTAWLAFSDSTCLLASHLSSHVFGLFIQLFLCMMLLIKEKNFLSFSFIVVELSHSFKQIIRCLKRWEKHGETENKLYKLIKEGNQDFFTGLSVFLPGSLKL